MKIPARRDLQILSTWCEWAVWSNRGGMGQNGSAHHCWMSQPSSGECVFTQAWMSIAQGGHELQLS